MSHLDVVSIPVLTDNYIFLLHDARTDVTAVIDPAMAAPVQAELAARGWHLDLILNTHHHPDHVDGNLDLKAATGATICGAAQDAERIPGIDRRVRDGDRIAVGSHIATVLETPGHTLGHIVFHFADDALLFAGDTLFVLGCGRLREGTAEQMWTSLRRLRDLPGDTLIYSAHEYAQTNAAFAATIEPTNAALQIRIAEIDRHRAAGRPTVPSRLSDECACNPFLRADRPALQAAVALNDTDPCHVFAVLRQRKNEF